MDAKHTPGPWLVENPSEGSPHIWITAKNDHGGVAKLEVCDYEDGRGERHTAEDQANAQLIAAAPDLLAALVAMEKAFGTEFAGGPAVAARAAIAKATGGAL